MDCPVCKTKGLPEEAKVCPNCQSDLESYGLLKQVDRKFKKKRLYLWIMFILIILLIVVWIFVPVNPKILQLKNENASLTQQVADLNNQSIQLQGELDKATVQNNEFSAAIKQMEGELAAARASGCKIHQVQPGETLSIIAKNYYGSEAKYLQIAKDNCLEDPDMIVVGQRLVIIGE